MKPVRTLNKSSVSSSTAKKTLSQTPNTLLPPPESPGSFSSYSPVSTPSTTTSALSLQSNSLSSSTSSLSKDDEINDDEFDEAFDQVLDNDPTSVAATEHLVVPLSSLQVPSLPPLPSIPPLKNDNDDSDLEEYEISPFKQQKTGSLPYPNNTPIEQVHGPISLSATLEGEESDSGGSSQED